MDHYCPWVYNSVGWKNHKYFVLFLVYASISLTYFLTCCLVRVIYEVQHREKAQTIFEFSSQFLGTDCFYLARTFRFILTTHLDVTGNRCYHVSVGLPNFLHLVWNDKHRKLHFQAIQESSKIQRKEGTYADDLLSSLPRI